MVQAMSCPNAAVLQRLLLGQTADYESVSLESHLLHCEKCLRTVQSLPPDDALISALQSGREFATPAPGSQLLEKLRLRLQEMPPSSLTGDTATAEITNPNAPTPAPAMIAEDSVWLRPPQQPDEIGRLGGYRVLKELGRGGMGAVYQAEDTKLKRLVALKVMLPRLAADASARHRFIREAQAMAAVHHDHVVTIFQVDEDNGVPFLAMEYLNGMPLDQWLRDGRKPNLAQILRMGREIAEGLAAAHARGLIHRDVKPGNIWLDSDHKGRVKILDFGLARVGTEDVHLTRSGAILGTPAYMSPEQASGQKVDARTDLFSLGCILYRFCTGAMPFSGDTTMALLTNLAISDPKHVRDLNANTPPALAELVMRLLAKKPADRPASAREVVQQLAAIEQNPQGAAKDNNHSTSQTEVIAAEVRPLPLLAKPRSRRRTAVLALVGAAAALIVAAAGAVIYVQTDRGTLEIKTSDPGVKVSIEQDGNQVDVLDAQSKQQLSIHSGTYTLRLTGGDGFEHEMVLDHGTNPVTLTRGGKVVVTVKRVDKTAVKTNPVETTKSAFPPLDEAWVRKVRDLPPEKQVEEVAAELKRRNPGFDGKMWPTIPNGVDVTMLTFSADNVTDLTPVRALSELESLYLEQSSGKQGPLSDLSPLKGMRLTGLYCSFTQVSDLSPLKDMKLTYLSCGRTRISDLSPLNGMPLTALNCDYSRVADLSPLKGLPLTDLHFGQTKVSDLSPLKDMKLISLNCTETSVSDLAPLKGMPLRGLAFGFTQVSNLGPLAGMPLTELDFHNSPVSDLSPLKGMKLTSLRCGSTQVADLSPLKGIPLEYLRFDGFTRPSDLSVFKDMPLKYVYGNFSPDRDAELLRSIKTLEQINGKPTAEFWKDFVKKPAFPPLDEAWAKKVRDLPAEKQVEEVAAELKRRNPGFDGKMTPSFHINSVEGLAVPTDDVADLTPLRALAQLENLNICPSVAGKSRLSDLSTIKDLKLTALNCNYSLVSDLSPLKDMKLTVLKCWWAPVHDLTPLQGMPLLKLDCNNTLVSDLSPLKDMKLTDLEFAGTRVSDLSVLRGMPLTILSCGNLPISDLSPLKDMKLTFLGCGGTRISDLSPLKNMPLTDLFCGNTPVSDLAPLKDRKLKFLDCQGTAISDLSVLKNMPLKEIRCDFKPERDAETLRSIKTLETINLKPAAEFWKEADAKPAEKKP